MVAMSRFLPATSFAAALIFAAIALPSLHAQEQEDEDSGGDTNVGLPEAYADFLISGSTLSPDKQFAVIYPKLEVCDAAEDNLPKRCKDYLVALEPFQILATVPTKYPYFEHRNHGYLSASWTEDNSAMLLTLESKWGPADVFLFELRDGKASRSTSLLPKVRALFLPDYKAAKMGPVDESAFVIESPDEGNFAEFIDPTHVRINCMATSDPKGNPGHRVWEASLDGVWDVAQARFDSPKVKRTFDGIRKEED